MGIRASVESGLEGVGMGEWLHPQRYEQASTQVRLISRAIRMDVGKNARVQGTVLSIALVLQQSEA